MSLRKTCPLPNESQLGNVRLLGLLSNTQSFQAPFTGIRMILILPTGIFLLNAGAWHEQVYCVACERRTRLGESSELLLKRILVTTAVVLKL